ncbi:cutinase family protein [Rhodococcus sp. IEGM 1366]|uniref:cutinase family protein n=1 Tax=Rhodococcus sp. IEGM 1366 TaxID=3082223 RepID=UPI0039895A6C
MEVGDKVELFFTPYTASAFDQGKTDSDSKATAIDKVSAVAAKCPQTTFIFSGYSQGADATGRDDIAFTGNDSLAAASRKSWCRTVPRLRRVPEGLLSDSDCERSHGPKVHPRGAEHSVGHGHFPKEPRTRRYPQNIPHVKTRSTAPTP